MLAHGVEQTKRTRTKSRANCDLELRLKIAFHSSPSADSLKPKKTLCLSLHTNRFMKRRTLPPHTSYIQGSDKLQFQLQGKNY